MKLLRKTTKIIIISALFCTFMAQAQAFDNPLDSCENNKSKNLLSAKPLSVIAVFPDLYIKQAVAVPNDNRHFRVQIANSGNADSTVCTLLLSGEVNGASTRKSFSVDVLAQGQTLWMIVDSEAKIDDFSSLSFRIDAPDQVKESDENNNFYIVK
jgi:hypothetical protein